MRAVRGSWCHSVSPLALLTLVLTVATIGIQQTVFAQTCSLVPQNTLSFTCYSACLQNQLCMAGATSTSKCLCFTAASTSTFRFLIPFNKTVAAKLLSSPPPATESVTGTNDTASYPWATNEVLTKINQWTLPANTENVYVLKHIYAEALKISRAILKFCLYHRIIRGGSSLAAISKGFVSNVDFADKFLDGQTKVTLLHLANLRLGPNIAKLATYFPRNLQTVDLSNGLITMFPSALTELKSLRRM